MKKYIAICLLGLLSVQGAFAGMIERNKFVVDSLMVELGKARTARDSLPVLFDIYDISPRVESDSIAGLVYRTAKRAGDKSGQLEMLRQLALINVGNDSIQTSITERVSKMAPTPERDATLTFVRLSKILSRLKYDTEENTRKYFHELLSRYTDNNDYSSEQQMEILYSMCIYLENMNQSQLLSRYLDQLGDIINAIPYKLDDLVYLYYGRATRAYCNSNEGEKSIAADRAIQNLLDRMEARLVAEGREYAPVNFAWKRYISLRRLLYNYEYLSESDVEKYYNGAKRLASISQDVAEDMKNNKRVDIYYLLAHKHYAEAIPLLKDHIRNNSTDNDYMHLMVKDLIKSARIVGDEHTLQEATRRYNELLENYLKGKSNENYKTLQIMLDLNSLKFENAQIEIEGKNAEIDYYHTIMILCGIAFIAFIVVSFILWRLYSNKKTLLRSLSESNAALTSERDALRRTKKDLIAANERVRSADKMKTEFVNNMSHEISIPLNAIVEYSRLIVDCIDDDRHAYLDNFAKTVKLNTSLALAIVGDVLDLASIDNSSMKVEMKPTTLHTICNMVVDTISIRLTPGVSLVYVHKDEPDTILVTDGRRVSQVLLNLLSNAIKFTEKGTVTLSYEVDRERDLITFAVTDTGIGVPKGKETEIFERFNKLNKYTQGIGLGLPIARLVAQLLNGSVKLDTTHRGVGARFLFTIPYKK